MWYSLDVQWAHCAMFSLAPVSVEWEGKQLTGYSFCGMDCIGVGAKRIPGSVEHILNGGRCEL